MRSHPLVLVCVAMFSTSASLAQSVDPPRRSGVTVSGIVHDSITGLPLSGAIVQIVSADTDAHFAVSRASDATGHYELRDVPAGRYLLGFLHAVLDSIGIEPPLRELRVQSKPVHADLSTPSAKSLRATICDAEGSGLVVGFVRRARDHSAAAGVNVVSEWYELTIVKKGFGSRVPRIVATTGENGWFALCNVPVNGTITLFAAAGADSTDVVELQVPLDGFLRKELFIGPERTGRLSGTVKGEHGEPLANALVRVANGAPARANAEGEWTLNEAPVGTRTVEVRAVGYYPERRTIDVVPGALLELNSTLLTMRTVLDTVHVSAIRLGQIDRAEFAKRQRMGAGKTLTAEDVAHRGGIYLTDVFRTIAGLKIGDAQDTLFDDFNSFIVDSVGQRRERRLLMRGIGGRLCAPAFYLNGIFLRELDADEIDIWAKPNEVYGIEVYFEAEVPAQFQLGRTGCGAIVIWKKQR